MSAALRPARARRGRADQANERHFAACVCRYTLASRAVRSKGRYAPRCVRTLLDTARGREQARSERRGRTVPLQPLEHAVVVHELPDGAVPAGLHAGRQRLRQHPLASARLQHGHERLVEQAERALGAAKVPRRLEDVAHAPVVALGVRRHDGDGGHELRAKEVPVQVLARLQVAQQALEHGAPAVGQHGRGQRLAGLVAEEAEAVARSCTCRVLAIACSLSARPRSARP